MYKVKLIIDCDPGIDDAVALSLIAAHKDKFEILCVTTVAGNVGIDNTTRNALNVLEHVGLGDIVVARGASKPLLREELKASGVHGVTGLRGWDFKEDSVSALSELSAVELIRSKLDESEEAVTIVVLGPATNIGMLLEKYPNIKNKIDKFVFMGTSYHDGNPTILSTFNVLVDPEAFRILLKSGIDIYACPLETTRSAKILSEELEEIKGINNKVSDMVYSILTSYGVKNILQEEEIGESNEEIITDNRLEREREETGVDVHDATTIAYLIQPDIFTTNRYYCDVECSGELTLGFTVIDKKNYYGKNIEEKNLVLMEAVKRDKLVQLMINSLKKFS